MLAARLVVGAGEHHPGELALGAGGRLQRDVRQPRDLAPAPAELPHQLQRTLRARRALSGCSRACPGSAATRSCSFGLCFIVHEPSG